MNQKVVAAARVDRGSNALGDTEDSMKQYLKHSVEMFDSLENSAIDRIGWIAYKLTCTRKQAESSQGSDAGRSSELGLRVI